MQSVVVENDRREGHHLISRLRRLSWRTADMMAREAVFERKKCGCDDGVGRCGVLHVRATLPDR